MDSQIYLQYLITLPDGVCWLLMDQRHSSAVAERKWWTGKDYVLNKPEAVQE